MKIVVALDGNLLLSPNDKLGISGQKEAVTKLAYSLSELVKAGHELVITHGNGPQVGAMLFRAEIASHAVYSLTLDVCGADTQGATGYLLQQSLRNVLLQQGIKKDITTVVTQVVVNELDPTCSDISKGIGPFFNQERARAYENSRNWNFILVPGRGYQRAVPALLPQQIIEANSIRYLLERKVIVICTGGGGIPVQIDEQGQLHGVDAVIDKSHTTALLAREIGAETIVFISRWEKIERAFLESVLNGLTCLSGSEVTALMAKKPKLDVSTRSKLIAGKKFLKSGGQSVLIISPEQLNANPSLGWGVRLLADKVLSN